MEILSVMCNSILGKNHTEISKGESIPVTRNSEGLCVLTFKDGRKPVTVPERDLYSCGFIIEETPCRAR